MELLVQDEPVVSKVRMAGMHDLRLYAHRGASRLLPENTIPAFRRALDDGATHLEMDVHLSRDGHVVVAHDADGNRMAGVNQRLCEVELSEIEAWNVGARFLPHPEASDREAFDPALSYRVPTLLEVIESFPGVGLNIDIKQHDLRAVNAVVGLLHHTGAAERCHIASFSAEALDQVRALDFRGTSGVASKEIKRILLLPRWFLGSFDGKGHALQLPRRSGSWPLDTRNFIHCAHHAGLRVDYWVINSAPEAAELFGRGADGVMTDDPARLWPTYQQALRRRG